MKKRDSFNNRLGFILACIGSAVGMGNLWMFPTRVSMYGGGSFLIPYFIFVILIGATGVIGEMAFGRASRSGPVNAFGMAMESKGKRRLGESIGLIPMAGALAMAIGYTVVMGWILKYAVGTFTGATLAYTDVDGYAGAFGGMASAFGNNIWQLGALVICIAITMLGIGKGIEDPQDRVEGEIVLGDVAGLDVLQHTVEQRFEQVPGRIVPKGVFMVGIGDHRRAQGGNALFHLV